MPCDRWHCEQSCSNRMEDIMSNNGDAAHIIVCRYENMVRAGDISTSTLETLLRMRKIAEMIQPEQKQINGQSCATLEDRRHK